MTSYYVEFSFDVSVPFSAEDEAHLDEVAAAFADLDGVDGDVGVDSGSGRVELCMTVQAVNRQEALLAAFTAARTAVHAAGGVTRTWDGWLDSLLDSDNYRSSISRSPV